MKTKVAFNSSKVVMRVAMPKGRWLRTAIFLDPEDQYLRWPEGGQIALVLEKQRHIIYNAFYFIISHTEHRIRERAFQLENGAVNDFHTYSVQWNDTFMEWMFDNNTTVSYNVTDVLAQYGVTKNPFSGHFRLEMTLSVGGKGFLSPSVDVVESDAQNWDCPLLIVDFVDYCKFEVNFLYLLRFVLT